MTETAAIASYQTICKLGPARDMALFIKATQKADRTQAKAARNGSIESIWFSTFVATYAA